MSHSSRSRARGPAPRRRREIQLEGFLQLEERCVMAPFLSVATEAATFTANATQPPGVNLGSVAITLAAHPASAAPLVSVAEFTPLSTFGGDIVRIKAVPGGDFGKGV